jgi:hypothetical protein
VAGDGQGRAAQYLYQQVGREFPSDPASATALYCLGRLQSDPTGELRNYRAAYMAFSRLVTEYPGSRWAPDARAWQAGAYLDIVMSEWRTEGAERRMLREALAALPKNLERASATLARAIEVVETTTLRVSQSGVLEKVGRIEAEEKERARWQREQATRERERQQREREAAERERGVR